MNSIIVTLAINVLLSFVQSCLSFSIFDAGRRRSNLLQIRVQSTSSSSFFRLKNSVRNNSNFNGNDDDDVGSSSRGKELTTKLQNQIQNINNLNDNDILNNEIESLNLKTEIESTITQLETIKNKTTPTSTLQERFQPTIGLYNVSYVLSKRKNENPVGGKWTRKNNKLAQRLLKTRRTMQHIVPVNSTSIGQLNFNVTNYELNRNKNKKKKKGSNTSTTSSEQDQEEDNYDDVRPVVAEAINVITLDALWNLIRISILLRGDVVPLSNKERTSSKMSQPLSNLAIKAYFDPPRIILSTGKKKKEPHRRSFLNLSIGPKSSVVLDTTYVDENVRIGMGGTSGTKFVFTKLCSKGDMEANEYKKLLLMKPTGKGKILSFLSIVAGCSGLLGKYYSSGTYRSGSNLILKVLGKMISFTSLILFFGTLFSTGGIEQDELRRRGNDVSK